MNKTNLNKTNLTASKQTNSTRNPKLLAAIGLFLCLLFIGSYSARLATTAALDTAIQAQIVRIEEAKQHTRALQQQLNYVRSDAYVEEVARNQLGLVQPGDDVVIIVQQQPAPAIQEATAQLSATPTVPFWQRWLEILSW